jgi:hypothetical protein
LAKRKRQKAKKEKRKMSTAKKAIMVIESRILVDGKVISDGHGSHKAAIEVAKKMKEQEEYKEHNILLFPPKKSMKDSSNTPNILLYHPKNSLEDSPEILIFSSKKDKKDSIEAMEAKLAKAKEDLEKMNAILAKAKEDLEKMNAILG